MSIEGRLEHRRIDTSSGSVTADEDWALKNTGPTLGDDLAEGELAPVGVHTSSIIVWFKSYNGMGGSAAPVADSTATLTVELVGLHRSRDKLVPTKGTELVLDVNERSARIDLPTEDSYVIRVKSGTVDTPDKALWLFVSTHVTD